MNHHCKFLLFVAMIILPGLAVGEDQENRAPEEEIQFGLLCDSGLTLAVGGYYEEALHLFDSLVNLRPGRKYIFYYRGLVHCHLGNYRSALKDLDQAAYTTHPENRNFDLGLIYARLENYKEAAKEFSKAVETANKDKIKPRALFNLGVAQEKIGEYKKALKAYKSLSDAAPDSFEKYIEIANERIEVIKASIESKTSPPGVTDLKFHDDLDGRLAKNKKIYQVIAEYPVQVYEEVPEYPLDAQTTGNTGYVIIHAYVNEFGKVTEAKAFRCNNYGFGFEEAAVAAAYKCRYKPARNINGTPVPLWIEYKVNFVL